MPLKKGNANIGAIYKGTTQIAKVYKGTKLLFENAKWLDYLFEHIYHSLIPTTISGKTVQDKAKLTKISGNGVVENQIDFNGDFHTNDSSYYSASEPDYMSMSIANNVLTCSLIRSISSGTTGNLIINTAYKGHKYLFSTLVKSTVGNNTVRIGFSIDNAVEYSDFLVNQGETKLLSGIYEIVTNVTTQTAIIRFQGEHSAGNTFESYYYEVIDLTLMFGTGNEPTTLTDNRIQALLNRGYIAYNTGSYKNSRVGEIECEPYNLFDEELEQGNIQEVDGQEAGGTQFRTKNFISVQPNKSYTLEYNRSNFDSPTYPYFYEYDENYNYLRQIGPYSTSSQSITTNEKTKYIKFKFYNVNNFSGYTPSDMQICFHLTGTRTGYAPYQAPTKITLPGLLDLNGAINSHDTFEITNTDYVFTRNVGVVDLGTLNWTILSEGNFYCSRNLEWKKPANDNTIGNIVCHLYTQDTATNVQSLNNYKDKTIGLNVDPQIIVRDSAYTTAADFKTAMAGMYAYLELATPQVITIPKKHLGCVDLGSLNWNYDSGNARFLSSDALSNAALPITSSTLANVYCGLYKTSATGLGLNNLEIALNPNGIVYVKNTAYTSVSAFKSAMAGQYLFYETEDEVSDFDNIAQINAGGSITSNSEVLPNVNFEIKCK